MYIHYNNIVKGAVLAALTLTGASQSQEVATDANSIDEIVVTATKRETSLMETAVAVSAFGQESLDNQGVKNLLDLDDMVPNLQIGLSPTDSGVQVVVRGLTSNNFTEIGDP
ncbi:MAG: TonB-dependent receptor plug domain-containing protein, partial [Porticoccaceae bacterium]